MGNRQPSTLKEGVHTDWSCILNRELNTWYEHIRSKSVKPSGVGVSRVYSDGKVSISHKQATGEWLNETWLLKPDEKRDGVVFRDDVAELLLYHDDHYTITIWGNEERTELSYLCTQKELSPEQLEYAIKLTKAVGLTFNYKAELLNELFYTNAPVVF
jgi:hypothetical protein